IPSTQSRQFWLALGILLISLLSAVMLLSGDGANPLAPVPIHYFVLWQTLSFGYLFFLPAIYALGLVFLWGAKRLSRIVLGANLVLAVLTVAWFRAGWETGMQYQGAF